MSQSELDSSESPPPIAEPSGMARVPDALSFGIHQRSDRLRRAARVAPWWLAASRRFNESCDALGCRRRLARRRNRGNPVILLHQSSRTIAVPETWSLSATFLAALHHKWNPSRPAREGQLLVDQRGCPTAFPQHQEGGGCLEANIERGAGRLGAQSVEVRQRWPSPMPSNRRKRDRCSIVTLTSAPPGMNGRWSSDGESIGSSSAKAIVGRASPARIRARDAWMSSPRSTAIRITSRRPSGDGSTGRPGAPASVDHSATDTAKGAVIQRAPEGVMATVQPC
jgi:hypothetical protein